MISPAFAQATPAAAPAAAGMDLFSLGFLALLFVLMYVMFIRPQQKRQKEHQKLVDAVQSGDEVLLAGGIVARVSKVEDQYLIVEIAKGVEIQIQRNAVTAMLPKDTISGF